MRERPLPTGTVTFLFSDIEGSTRLVQELGATAYTELLERHNAILRAAFERHGGTERGTQGDSFLVTFPEAPATRWSPGWATRLLAQKRDFIPGNSAPRRLSEEVIEELFRFRNHATILGEHFWVITARGTIEGLVVRGIQ